MFLSKNNPLFCNHKFHIGENVFYKINFSFNYSCKDGSDNCLPEVFKKYGYKYDNNQASITAYTDEIEIFKLEHFAININDNYKQTDIIIY